MTARKKKARKKTAKKKNAKPLRDTYIARDGKSYSLKWIKTLKGMPISLRHVLAGNYLAGIEGGEGPRKSKSRAWDIFKAYHKKEGGKWREKTKDEVLAQLKKIRKRTTNQSSSSTSSRRPRGSASKANPPMISVGGKLIKTAPIPISKLANAAELGRVLDLRVGNREISFMRGKKPAMYYSPSAKTLFFVDGTLKESRKRQLNTTGKEARLFGEWTDGRRSASNERDVTIPDRVFNSVRSLGNAVSLAYRSDKFDNKGDTVDYNHQFGRGVRVYMYGTKGTPKVFAIRGGNMTVTRRGIVN